MELSLGNIQGQVINSLIGVDINELKCDEGKDYFCVDFDCRLDQIVTLIGHFHSTPKFYFKNKAEDTEFLGLGSLKTFKSLYDFEEIDQVANNNPCIKIMGGKRFQNEECAIEWHGLEECFFFIPNVIFEKIENKIRLRVILPNDFLTDENKKKEYLYDLANTLDPFHLSFIEHNNFPISRHEVPDYRDWENMINKSLNKLNETELEKIVLSRKKVVKYKRKICSEDFFFDIHDSIKQKSYCIYFKFSNQQKFISFTPETLFKVKDNYLILDSLAGTRPRGSNEAEDKKLENELLSNSKELNEHRVVTDYISKNMASHVDEVIVEHSEEILKQKYVQHIHTLLKGKLDNKTKTFDLISTFHPTPAVGGAPKTDALELIKELEPYTRGLYAAPVGFLSANESEFSVAIRCALIDGDKLHVYGGCGIVKDSMPKSEWLETKNKMKNFKIALGGEA